MQSNYILKRRSKVILWMFPLYFSQIANEHVKYLCVINNYNYSWRTVDTSNEGSSCVARATSLPSSTVDRSTGKDNIIMF